MSESIMRQAIQLAVENVRAGLGGPFAAIIVRDGEIIASGSNRVTSANDPTAHAEINAIRKACTELQDFQLVDCDIYTTCEPCPMCMGAIYWARLNRVFYASGRADAREAGFDDDLIYEELRRDPNERAIEMIRLLSEEGRQAFQVWGAQENRVDY